MSSLQKWPSPIILKVHYLIHKYVLINSIYLIYFLKRRKISHLKNGACEFGTKIKFDILENSKEKKFVNP